MRGGGCAKQHFRCRPTMVAPSSIFITVPMFQDGCFDKNSSMVIIHHNDDQETEVSVVRKGRRLRQAAFSSPPHNGCAKQHFCKCCKPRYAMFISFYKWSNCILVGLVWWSGVGLCEQIWWDHLSQK